MKHFLKETDFKRAELSSLFSLARDLKRKRGRRGAPTPLKGQTWALIFSKSSTRTRVSFEVGVRELGGSTMFLNPADIQLGRGEPERARAFCGWLLNATRGYALKVVNPGGVEVWKQGGSGLAHLDDEVPGFGVSPRAIVCAVARAADELGLPHPAHIHCNQLGMPGNWTTTLDTMRAVDGHRGHLTHIQFHSYGGGPDDQGTFCSKVPQLAEYVNAHANLTVDVGQVLFGETTSMTGDGPAVVWRRGIPLGGPPGTSGGTINRGSSAGPGWIPLL